MSLREPIEFEDEEFVDVRSLPLKPPQPAPQLEKAARRPWHPVMWDDTIIGLPPPDHKLTASQDESQQKCKEYPHKQRLRNLRRLIAEGKVKPTQETLIYFLCNKFAVSDERKAKVAT